MFRLSRGCLRAFLGLAIVGLWLAPRSAVAELDLPYVIKARSIVVAPGQILDNASLVVADGIIQEVGTNVTVPKGAKVLEFDKLTVYPGLIESYHPRSFADRAGKEDESEPVELGHPSDLIQPERNASTAEYSEEEAKKLRNAGFTLAVGVPSKGIFRGGAILQTLGNGSLQENLVRLGVAQVAGLDQSGDGEYPTSLMGSIALFRQVVSDARWYHDAGQKYSRDPAQRTQENNISLAALDALVDKHQVLLFETGTAQGALRALALLKQTDLDGYLVGSGKEYQRLAEIAAAGRPILLPVDFPSAPEVTSEDDDSVAAALEPSLADLRHWKAAPANPAKLLGAGTTVAFTTYELGSPSDIFPNLAKAIEHGLTQEQALAGLTTVPAELYGLERIAGTIEQGKMANFVLAEGDLFVEKPKIQEVWVAGRRYQFEEIKPPEVNPVGKWEIKVAAGGQTIEGVLRIRGSLEALGGVLEVMGATLPISDVTVSAKTAILTIDTSGVGMPGDMTLRLTIDGDSGSGSGDGPMGAFSFSAKRTSSTPDGGVRQ